MSNISSHLDPSYAKNYSNCLIEASGPNNGTHHHHNQPNKPSTIQLNNLMALPPSSAKTQAPHDLTGSSRRSAAYSTSNKVPPPNHKSYYVLNDCFNGPTPLLKVTTSNMNSRLSNQKQPCLNNSCSRAEEQPTSSNKIYSSRSSLTKPVNFD